MKNTAKTESVPWQWREPLSPSETLENLKLILLDRIWKGHITMADVERRLTGSIVGGAEKSA